MWDVTKLGKQFDRRIKISTHTSRVGCDLEDYEKDDWKGISTHTSRVGCDGKIIFCCCKRRFLLTHPVWDVTAQNGGRQAAYEDFYSHIPCGM